MKKKKSRLNSLFPILTAGLLLTQQAQTEEKTLELWTWYPPESVLNKVIDGFETDHPGVKVNLNLFEASAYQDRMPLALASGDPMDIVAVQTSTMVDLVKDDLSPLPPLFATHTDQDITALISEKALNQARGLSSDGELYIAPLGILGSVAVYYNARLLEELNLDIPRTRSDLAHFVTRVKEQRPDLLPFSFTGANWFIDEITLTVAEQVKPGFFDSIRYQRGGRWDDDAWITAFNAVVSAYDDGFFSRDALDLDYSRANELFQQGKAVALIQGTWESGLLSTPYRKENGIALDNVVAAGLPVLTTTGQPAIRSFIEVGLAIPKQAQNLRLSTLFVEYMSTGKGVALWSESLFVVPTAKNFNLPDRLFNTARAKASYEEISALLQNPGSNRNNVSDFAAVAGDAIIAGIIKGASADTQAAYLQAEWESGRYSNAE